MTHNWKHFYKFNKQQRNENKQIKPWMVVMDGIGWTDQMLANIFKMHKSVLEPRCAASSSILPFSFTD